ncbi:RAMP superfamily protein [Paenibacillus konkukensis]|uniref:RAMP superfamily protein n=1 Tax=Paenibacillus konkukensis TaxID=2020716 RepID=A0ABY4RUF6_9BACL|nr:RAMP superfamily CRISPR-associated protein [Paenibacillus konkukensis]UQZ85435.1 RAMP superfamily protein [Paenibacillus konkukensis]
MNARLIYTFHLKAVTPVHFGDGQGDLVENSKGQHVLPGTSIGGALRECLAQAGLADVPDGLIGKYMGYKDETSGDFVESRLFISNGKLAGNFVRHTQEGTAIDRASGAAASHLKYQYDYLDGDLKMAFRIQCDVSDGAGNLCRREELERQLIDVWAEGIRRGILRFGGKKNHDFGRFSLIGIERIIHPLDCVEALDAYIFSRQNCKGEEYRPGILDPNPFDTNSNVLFRLQGSFPYGVYQSYTLPNENESRSLTGVRQNSRGYYLPASSIKGLLRSEVELLITRMTGSEDMAMKKCCQLFGSPDEAGQILFSPLQIDDAAEVEVKRYRENDNNPVYIKIDRLTGGAYSSALKQQREIQGSGVLEFRLKVTTDSNEDSPYLFPLVYVLRRIGSGQVPLGGRTVIGLGQFMASQTVVNNGKQSLTFENDGELPESQRSWLKRWYEQFERWCHQVDEA